MLSFSFEEAKTSIPEHRAHKMEDLHGDMWVPLVKAEEISLPEAYLDFRAES